MFWQDSTGHSDQRQNNVSARLQLRIQQQKVPNIQKFKQIVQSQRSSIENKNQIVAIIEKPQLKNRRLTSQGEKHSNLLTNGIFIPQLQSASQNNNKKWSRIPVNFQDIQNCIIKPLITTGHNKTQTMWAQEPIVVMPNFQIVDLAPKIIKENYQSTVRSEAQTKQGNREFTVLTQHSVTNSQQIKMHQTEKPDSKNTTLSNFIQSSPYAKNYKVNESLQENAIAMLAQRPESKVQEKFARAEIIYSNHSNQREKFIAPHTLKKNNSRAESCSRYISIEKNINQFGGDRSSAHRQLEIEEDFKSKFGVHSSDKRRAQKQTKSMSHTQQMQKKQPSMTEVQIQQEIIKQQEKILQQIASAYPRQKVKQISRDFKVNLTEKKDGYNNKGSLIIERNFTKTFNLKVETNKIEIKEPKTADSVLKGKNSLLTKPSEETQKQVCFYDPKVKIGQGKHGPVDLIIVDVCKGQRELRALKRISKHSLDNPKRIEHVKNEKAVLNMLKKYENVQLDFIVQFYESFTDTNNICFMFEYLSGQDLFWVVQNEHNLNLGKKNNRKQWVLFYCAELLVALHQLHHRNIIYRDLKPENVMIDDQGHIKLIDFGFAKKLGADQRTYTNCGTLGYTAPEVIHGKGGYSFPADLWSFGILIVEMLTGSLPFEEKNDPVAIQQQIVQGDIRFQKDLVDQSVRDLLQQIFIVEPNLRTTLQGIMQHKAFVADQGKEFWKQVAKKKINGGEVPYKPNPQKYKYLLQNEYELTSNIQKNQKDEPQSPLEDPKTPKKAPKLLGNFTIYKVNKEFENF